MEAWPLFLMLLAINSTPAGAADEFVVTAPAKPILAIVGRDAVLDCQLVPGKFLPDMELRWINVDLSYTSPVHMYKGGMDELAVQALAYQGRTQLFHDLIDRGNLSLKLMNVQVSDQGQYKCFVATKVSQNEIKMSLSVAATGIHPQIEMQGYTGNGIRVGCSSKGWFPEPQIQWKDGNGANVMVTPKTTLQADPQGLYSIESTIEVSRGNRNTYSCQVVNKALNEFAQASILISDSFFPQTSAWQIVFWVLVLFVLAGLGLVYLLYRKMRQRIDDVKKSSGALKIEELKEELEKQKLVAEEGYEKLRREKAEAVQAEKSELEKLKKKFEVESSTITANYKKLQTEFEQWRPLVKSEWDRMRSHAVVVRPDPNTANACLEVSSTAISAKTGPPLTVPDIPERFDAALYVLGTEGFVKGAHFWEVEVASKSYWDIGVVLETIQRKGMPNLSTSNGFWTFGRDGEAYTVSDKNHSSMSIETRPTKIAVFLDLGAGKLSFYDADTMFHLYTFNTSFSGKVYPFFSPGWSQPGLIICPINS
ncbi:butyrophilin subfamily 3 member A3-like [Hemitrygon akajei]|uniref:butyrophilin subfamily 3 member A3-like n=1 Tax=Hemitrygon akajei TaxID=2704970 RepID=UPI003BF9F15C